MTGNNIPNIVDKYTKRGVNYRAINFNVNEVEYGYEWDSVELPAIRWDYGGIIDALVTYKYPNDKMQSVINNYLLDPTDETIVKEFNEMQAWRKEAKEIAKQALEYEVS